MGYCSICAGVVAALLVLPGTAWGSDWRREDTYRQTAYYVFHAADWRSDVRHIPEVPELC